MSRWWLAIVLIAAIAREVMIRLGYSWWTGGVVALLIGIGLFVAFRERLLKR